MQFEETYTDREFERALRAANADLFARERATPEPDLSVPGLSGSIVSRLLSLLIGDSRSTR